MCGKNFSIYGDHIPRKYIESMHFYACPSPPLKAPGRFFFFFFENLFSPRRKGWRKLYRKLFYQNSIRKYEDDSEISLVIFCMICNFSECDGFTVS